MKNPVTFMSMLLLIFCAGHASAQLTRSKNQLFNEVRTNTACSQGILDKVFDARLNSNVSIYISDQLTLTGEVTDRTIVAPGVETISIRCSNFHNALLNVSRTKLSDNTIRYNGGIINREFADVLMLKYENGQYFFRKDQLALVMVD